MPDDQEGVLTIGAPPRRRYWPGIVWLCSVMCPTMWADHAPIAAVIKHGMRARGELRCPVGGGRADSASCRLLGAAGREIYMVVYAIFTREKTLNAAEFETYSRMAPAALEGRVAKVLAFFGAFEVMEGAPIEGAVIIQFPSWEDAKAWYTSPAYQAALPHRQAGAEFRVFFVEAVA